MYAFTDIAQKNAVTPTRLALKELLNLIPARSKADTELLTRAYHFSKKHHEGQKRYSGDPYFHHPFEVAKYLAGMHMPVSIVVAGLLHDVCEDADIPLETIEYEFGSDIASMVEGVTKLGRVRYHGMKRHTESLRKLVAATSRDVRVIIVKLMDRLHNARTLHFVPEHKRNRIALETLEIYAPIADRLGIGLLKRELEDAVFPHAFPKEYEHVLKLFSEAGGDDIKKLESIKKSMRTKIREYGFKEFRTESRIKGLYSFFRKLERKEWDVTKIYDLWALRIVVNTVADCYTVLGIIHGEWKPMPGRFKDYIAFEKPNGYQSLHTTIHTKDGSFIEVQIRTEKMHREAQFGIASHFSYKEATSAGGSAIGSSLDWFRQFVPHALLRGGKRGDSKQSESGIATYAGDEAPEWIRHMAELQESGDASSFLSEAKTDFFSHRIFVFTPRGDVIDLPLHSSPIDFAYAIHSDIGDHMSGAKVNGKMAALNTCLKNGDIVEITTSDKARPNRKWLTMAKTSLAKRHIRAYVQKGWGKTGKKKSDKKKRR